MPPAAGKEKQAMRKIKSRLLGKLASGTDEQQATGSACHCHTHARHVCSACRHISGDAPSAPSTIVIRELHKRSRESQWKLPAARIRDSLSQIGCSSCKTVVLEHIVQHCKLGSIDIANTKWSGKLLTVPAGTPHLAVQGLGDLCVTAPPSENALKQLVMTLYEMKPLVSTVAPTAGGLPKALGVGKQSRAAASGQPTPGVSLTHVPSSCPSDAFVSAWFDGLDKLAHARRIWEREVGLCHADGTSYQNSMASFSGMGERNNRLTMAVSKLKKEMELYSEWFTSSQTASEGRQVLRSKPLPSADFKFLSADSADPASDIAAALELAMSLWMEGLTKIHSAVMGAVDFLSFVDSFTRMEAAAVAADETISRYGLKEVQDPDTGASLGFVPDPAHPPGAARREALATVRERLGELHDKRSSSVLSLAEMAKRFKLAEELAVRLKQKEVKNVETVAAAGAGHRPIGAADRLYTSPAAGLNAMQAAQARHFSGEEYVGETLKWFVELGEFVHALIGMSTEAIHNDLGTILEALAKRRLGKPLTQAQARQVVNAGLQQQVPTEMEASGLTEAQEDTCKSRGHDDQDDSQQLQPTGLEQDSSPLSPEAVLGWQQVLLLRARLLGRNRGMGHLIFGYLDALVTMFNSYYLDPDFSATDPATLAAKEYRDQPGPGVGAQGSTVQLRVTTGMPRTSLTGRQSASYLTPAEVGRCLDYSRMSRDRFTDNTHVQHSPGWGKGSGAEAASDSRTYDKPDFNNPFNSLARINMERLTRNFGPIYTSVRQTFATATTAGSIGDKPASVSVTSSSETACVVGSAPDLSILHSPLFKYLDIAPVLEAYEVLLDLTRRSAVATANAFMPPTDGTSSPDYITLSSQLWAAAAELTHRLATLRSRVAAVAAQKDTPGSAAWLQPPVGLPNLTSQVLTPAVLERSSGPDKARNGKDGLEGPTREEWELRWDEDANSDQGKHRKTLHLGEQPVTEPPAVSHSSGHDQDNGRTPAVPVLEPEALAMLVQLEDALRQAALRLQYMPSIVAPGLTWLREYQPGHHDYNTNLLERLGLVPPRASNAIGTSGEAGPGRAAASAPAASASCTRLRAVQKPWSEDVTLIGSRDNLPSFKDKLDDLWRRTEEEFLQDCADPRTGTRHWPANYAVSKLVYVPEETIIKSNGELEKKFTARRRFTNDLTLNVEQGVVSQGVSQARDYLLFEAQVLKVDAQTRGDDPHYVPAIAASNFTTYRNHVNQAVKDELSKKEADSKAKAAGKDTDKRDELPPGERELLPWSGPSGAARPFWYEPSNAPPSGNRLYIPLQLSSHDMDDKDPYEKEVSAFLPRACGQIESGLHPWPPEGCVPLPPEVADGQVFRWTSTAVVAEHAPTEFLDLAARMDDTAKRNQFVWGKLLARLFSTFSSVSKAWYGLAVVVALAPARQPITCLNSGQAEARAAQVLRDALHTHLVQQAKDVELELLLVEEDNAKSKAADKEKAKKDKAKDKKKGAAAAGSSAAIASASSVSVMSPVPETAVVADVKPAPSTTATEALGPSNSTIDARVSTGVPDANTASPPAPVAKAEPAATESTAGTASGRAATDSKGRAGTPKQKRDNRIQPSPEASATAAETERAGSTSADSKADGSGPVQHAALSQEELAQIQAALASEPEERQHDSSAAAGGVWERAAGSKAEQREERKLAKVKAAASSIRAAGGNNFLAERNALEQEYTPASHRAQPMLVGRGGIVSTAVVFADKDELAGLGDDDLGGLDGLLDDGGGLDLGFFAQATLELTRGPPQAPVASSPPVNQPVQPSAPGTGQSQPRVHQPQAERRVWSAEDIFGPLDGPATGGQPATAHAAAGPAVLADMPPNAAVEQAHSRPSRPRVSWGPVASVSFEPSPEPDAPGTADEAEDHDQADDTEVPARAHDVSDQGPAGRWPAAPELQDTAMAAPAISSPQAARPLPMSHASAGMDHALLEGMARLESMMVRVMDRVGDMEARMEARLTRIEARLGLSQRP